MGLGIAGLSGGLPGLSTAIIFLIQAEAFPRIKRYFKILEVTFSQPYQR